MLHLKDFPKRLKINKNFLIVTSNSYNVIQVLSKMILFAVRSDIFRQSLKVIFCPLVKVILYLPKLAQGNYHFAEQNITAKAYNLPLGKYSCGVVINQYLYAT